MPEPPPDLDARGGPSADQGDVAEPGGVAEPGDPIDPADRPWRLDAAVSGRVQGVGYRYFVIDEAYRLALTGWVVNEFDGSVHCVAEGPRPTLERFLAALWAGPPAARVESVIAAWSPAVGGLEGFRVRSRGHSGD